VGEDTTDDYLGREMTKNPASGEQKSIGRHALSAFGGKPKIQVYIHNDMPFAVDILSVADSPSDGIASYSTIGLFETALDRNEQFGTRVELCGAMLLEVAQWSNVVASASFALMRSRRSVKPGRVLEGYVAEYYPETSVPHLYLTIPFLWNNGHFPELVLDNGIKINWLQVIPISTDEREILRTCGDSAFEDLLEKSDVDVFDLNRTTL
jgi:hypothetical protein